MKITPFFPMVGNVRTYDDVAVLSTYLCTSIKLQCSPRILAVTPPILPDVLSAYYYVENVPINNSLLHLLNQHLLHPHYYSML